MNPPRQRKQSRDELRAMLLEAGRAIVAEEGIDTRTSNLTFKRAFERVADQTGVRVTNASVIRRVWENQAEFQADVLVAVVADEERPELNARVSLLSSALDGVDLTSTRQRAWALQEVCRVAGLDSSDLVGTSPAWSLWISTVAIATSSDPAGAHQRVHEALAGGFALFVRTWEGVVSGLLGLLGYRVRPPWTTTQFTTSLLTFLQGNALRQHIDGEVELIVRPTGPDGQDQVWALASAGIEALVLQFCEEDPDYVPPGS